MIRSPRSWRERRRGSGGSSGRSGVRFEGFGGRFGEDEHTAIGTSNRGVRRRRIFLEDVVVVKGGVFVVGSRHCSLLLF